MTDPSTPPAPPPYSDHGAPGNTDAARIAAETMRRTAEQAAHEQMRASFLRDLTDPAQEHAPPRSDDFSSLFGQYASGPASAGTPPSVPPLYYYPPTVGARPPPSCCGPTACGPACAEEDDSVTDDLRDLVTPQVLAMTTARTKQGVATAAVAILMAARGDVLIDSVTRGLRRVLGAAGDLLDGIDLDALGRQVVEQMGVPVAKAAPAKPAGEGLRIAVPVEIDGAVVGTVSVPVFAGERDVIEAIRGEAVLMAKIAPGRRVTSVEYVPGKVARIATGPDEAAPVADSVPRG